MDTRELKGLQIAATLPIKRSQHAWVVPSQTGHGSYTAAHPTLGHLEGALHGLTCTCPDFELRQLPCKHIIAVEYTVKREPRLTRPASRPAGSSAGTTTSGGRSCRPGPSRTVGRCGRSVTRSLVALLRPGRTHLRVGSRPPTNVGRRRRRLASTVVLRPRQALDRRDELRTAGGSRPSEWCKRRRGAAVSRQPACRNLRLLRVGNSVLDAGGRGFHRRPRVGVARTGLA